MKSSIDLGIARSGIGLSRSAIRFVAPVLIALFVGGHIHPSLHAR